MYNVDSIIMSNDYFLFIWCHFSEILPETPISIPSWAPSITWWIPLVE